MRVGRASRDGMRRAAEPLKRTARYTFWGLGAVLASLRSGAFPHPEYLCLRCGIDFLYSKYYIHSENE